MLIYHGTAIGDAAYVGNIVGWHSHKWEDRDTKNDTNSPKQNTKCLLRSPSPAHKKIHLGLHTGVIAQIEGLTKLNNYYMRTYGLK